MSVARKVVLALFCIALAPTVLADKIKDVNVVNTPDVNVVNNENSPVPVTIQNDAQSIVEWRYVGYTDHKDNGRFEYAGLIGIAAMNKACADDFGPGARAATISEALFMNSPLEDSGPSFQWLVPGGPMTAELHNNGIYVAIDAATGTWLSPAGVTSPAVAMNSAYCNNYSQDQFNRLGALLERRGTITRGACNLSDDVPAACSAPVEIPVTQ